MQIRPAKSTDIETCASLDHSCFAEYAWRMEEREQDGIITAIFQPVRLPRQARVLYPRQDQDLVAGWESCDLFLVAVLDDQVRAYAAARSLPGHGLLWLHDLVVDRGWRERGVGSELLKNVAGWARERNLQRLVAETHTKNYPGICFLRSRGLAFCGYNDRHWRAQEIAVLFGQRVR